MRVAILPSGALLADTAPVDGEASDGLSVAGRAGRFRCGLPTDDHDRNDTGDHRDPAVDSQEGKLLRQCHFRGIVRTMKAVIDRAGRIVVPKPLRQALGLRPGQPLEIRAGDGRLEIEIASTPMKLKKRGKGLVAVPEAKLPPLTAEQVRDTLERVRR